MLDWILAISSLVLWGGGALIYFRYKIIPWLDNRYGPATKKEKVRRRRFRFYD